ncbi:hypothetical protein Purlil1_1149 [Purpureocillium lilacinum]|uniref:Uncharacterized protein n=1 Tax=Purpureocillium lilacinum TaxID=33203 RepID=A0ABR0CDN4_PURLI|nr:hypothetical protein Purlil1_1149 [Purpureocillium lilacinum]
MSALKEPRPSLSKTSNPQGKGPSLLLQSASPRRAAQDASPGRGLPEEDSWGMVGEWLAERAAVGMNIILYRFVSRPAWAAAGTAARRDGLPSQTVRHGAVRCLDRGCAAPSQSSNGDADG